MSLLPTAGVAKDTLVFASAALMSLMGGVTMSMSSGLAFAKLFIDDDPTTPERGLTLRYVGSQGWGPFAKQPLLVALWFVVAITTVGLALGVAARERRAFGLVAADREAGRAATLGGLATAQARMEQALRQQPLGNGSNVAQLRAADSWLDLDRLFRDTVQVGDFKVLIRAEDLGAKLNINGSTSSETRVAELRALLGFVLQDDDAADALMQAIDDWRDRDDLRQPRGAERAEYLRSGALDLPTNRGEFSSLDELRTVHGITPEVFARIRPYLRVRDDGNQNRIHINTAPAAVLRAVGMSDATVRSVLAIRSQHQRITREDIEWEKGFLANAANREGWSDRVTFTTWHIELTVIAVPPPPSHIMRQVWMIQKSNDGYHAQVNWLGGGNAGPRVMGLS